MVFPLLVGQNPGRGSYRRSPSIVRIDRWMDACGVLYYSLVNVGQETGDKYTRHPELVLEACRGFSRVISLGGVADRTLVRLGVEHLALPHPSPRNRMWNDPETERRCVSLCQEYLGHGDSLRLLDAGPLLHES